MSPEDLILLTCNILAIFAGKQKQLFAREKNPEIER